MNSQRARVASMASYPCEDCGEVSWKNPQPGMRCWGCCEKRYKDYKELEAIKKASPKISKRSKPQPSLDNHPMQLV